MTSNRPTDPLDHDHDAQPLEEPATLITHASDLSALLGRRPAPDTRDARFPMRAALATLAPLAAAAPLPGSRYWWAGDPLNQALVVCPESGRGGRHPYCREQGFCVGAAWRQSLTTSPRKTRGGPDLLGIYHRAQELDEWDGGAESYAGTSVRAGAKMLREAGLLTEYRWISDAATLQQTLAFVGPVVVGTDWDWSMFTPDAAGFVHPEGDVAGGHAYLIVGANFRRKAYRLLNSWGLTWNPLHRGRAWISFDDLHALVFERDFGEACCGIEPARVALRPAA